MMNRYQITLNQGWNDSLSAAELMDITGINSRTLQYFLEYSLIEPVEESDGQLIFNINSVLRIRMIQRLRTEIGINLSGIAIILRLRDQIEQLQRDLDWFKTCNN